MNNIIKCVILLMASVKIFCNISISFIKEEVSIFEYLVRSIETMICCLIVAILLN